MKKLILLGCAILFGMTLHAQNIPADTWYTLSNSIKVLDVYGLGSGESRVLPSDDTGAINQQWRFEKTEGGNYLIVAKVDKELLLTVKGEQVYRSKRDYVRDPRLLPSAYQMWKLEDVSYNPGAYYLKNVATNKYLIISSRDRVAIMSVGKMPWQLKKINSPLPKPDPGDIDVDDYDAIVDAKGSAGLRVRSGPGTNHPVLGELVNGKKVKVTHHNEDWRRILYNNKPAYVYKHLEPSPPEESKSLSEHLKAVVKNPKLNSKVYADLIKERKGNNFNLNGGNQRYKNCTGRNLSVKLQSIYNSEVNSKKVKLDEYSVVVKMGSGEDPKQWLKRMAKDMDDFLGQSVKRNADFQRCGNSTAQVGDIIYIDLKERVAGNYNAPVIITRMWEKRFVFQSIQLGVKHPLHITREFGYNVRSNGNVKFFTHAVSVENMRGATHQAKVNLLNGLDGMWKNWLDGIEKKVEQTGGKVIPNKRISEFEQISTGKTLGQFTRKTILSGQQRTSN